MGIYVFKKDVLVKLLKDKYPHANDFGGEIIPWAASDGHKVGPFDNIHTLHAICHLADENSALREPCAASYRHCKMPVSWGHVFYCGSCGAEAAHFGCQLTVHSAARTRRNPTAAC